VLCRIQRIERNVTHAASLCFTNQQLHINNYEGIGLPIFSFCLVIWLDEDIARQVLLSSKISK
jgi:hypothetical protein